MVKNVERIISYALYLISMVTITLLLLSGVPEAEVGPSRLNKHPFTPTTMKTLKVAQAYSGPSRRGAGHNIIR
ncbi:hypothetical protein GQ457_12G018260 [Hibiscus cannabinus]